MMSEDTKKINAEELMAEIHRKAGAAPEDDLPDFSEVAKKELFDSLGLERYIGEARASMDLSKSFEPFAGNPVKRVLKKISTKILCFFMFRQGAFNVATVRSFDQLHNYVVREELRRRAREDGYELPEKAEKALAAQEAMIASLGTKVAQLAAQNEKLTAQMAQLSQQNENLAAQVEQLSAQDAMRDGNAGH